MRQLSVEFHLPNKEASNISKYLTIEEYRSLVKIVKSIEERMTQFESRANPCSVKRITILNHFKGPICFEISFYQIVS